MRIMLRKHSVTSSKLAQLAIAVALVIPILACQFTASPTATTRSTTRTPKPTPTIKINIPKETEIPSPNGRQLGDTNAPVIVEVFSDFQCPACGLYARDVEPKIIQQYIADGKVLYIYRHYPFIGDESIQAANASMCAGEQNRFWEYHALLFANTNGENQGAFNDDHLLAFAKIIPLDMVAFSACFEQKRYQSEIDQDLALGKSKGISAVPSVFVNGAALTPGAMPSVKDLQKAIDNALGQP
jgi:protein-disulfide isomerase